MHCEMFIAKLTEVQRTVEHLLAQLQASEHDKSSDLSSQASESLKAWALRATCDQWEQLMRIGDCSRLALMIPISSQENRGDSPTVSPN
jgi:hypothetical protein